MRLLLRVRAAWTVLRGRPGAAIPGDKELVSKSELEELRRAADLLGQAQAFIYGAPDIYPRWERFRQLRTEKEIK